VLLHADPARANTFVVNAWNEGSARPFDASCDPWDGVTKDCLLRDAIAAANANPGSDTIVFSVVEPGFVGIIPLHRSGSADDTNDRGDLDAWDTQPGSTLEIVGTGTLEIVSNQPWSERILHALPTGSSKYAVDVVLDGVTFASGHETAGPGGCVLVEEGFLEATDVVFENCYSSQAKHSGPGGGAVAAYGGATLVRTEIRGSLAINGDGGGLYVEGDFVADVVGVVDNATSVFGDGGGISWNGDGYTASLTEVEVFSNTSARQAGGLHVKAPSGTLTVADSAMTFNTTSMGWGGGAWLHAENMTLERVRFDGNVANRGGGAYVIPGPSAGSAPLMNRVSVVNNSATMEGGGLFVHTTLTSGGTHLIRNSTVGANTCGTGGPGGVGCGAWLGTGALGSSSAGLVVRLQHVTLAHNVDDGTGDLFALQVQGTGHGFELENSIIEGVCHYVLTPAGSYTSLGGNVVHENSLTTLQQQCASTSGDAWPVVIHTGSLWGATPVLVSGVLPYYDPFPVTDAIDFVTCPSGVAIDQVGNPRPIVPGTCDAGAYEL
jgi:hypothetical protein